LHLLTSHAPGNELHLVPEVSIPGGSVDYVLISTDCNRKVKDFVGIELQTMDTTGSVWYERQLALKEVGLRVNETLERKSFSDKAFSTRIFAGKEKRYENGEFRDKGKHGSSEPRKHAAI